MKWEFSLQNGSESFSVCLQERQLQEGRAGAGVWGGAALQNLLRAVWLRAERVDEGGGSAGLGQRHQRQNANRAPEDGGRAEDRRWVPGLLLCCPSEQGWVWVLCAGSLLAEFG